jgi:CPA1 family monovalent cation:H+ antiporter
VHEPELIVALLAVSVILAGFAHVIGVHYAIVLVLGGLALGFLPGVPRPRAEPNLIFFVFLPPLIYAAAFRSSTQDLRANLAAISRLSVGLVIATVVTVAVIAHVLTGIGWGPAVVLGAVLGPTDPVAATSVLQRLGAPDRIATILQGESLVNDATALTIYKLAVAAVASGHYSVGAGVGQFAVAIAGAVIGLVAAWASAQVRRRIQEPRIEISISLLTAYLAYIPADRLGTSGILAAVAAGLYTGHQAESILSPESRLQALSFWEVLTFLLESVLFLLIGLELEGLVTGLHGAAARLVVYASAVTAALLAIRMAWMFAVPALVRTLNRARPTARPQRQRAEQLVTGWSGMRGAVSLAAALSIPITVGHHAFPARGTVIFIAYVAIIVTLVVPGATLPLLVRRLGLSQEEELGRAEARARVQLAHAALQRLEQLAEEEQLPARVIDQLRNHYEWRIHRFEPELGDDERGGDEADMARRVRELQRELVRAEHERLHELRRAGEISAESQRRLERELDLEQARLAA